MNAGLSIALQLPYDSALMRLRARQLQLGAYGFALFLALGAIGVSMAAAGNAAVGPSGQTVFCPLSGTELSALVGRKLQRVALGGGKAGGQCAFSAVEGTRAVNPQIYLTLGPGNAADLRDSYRYYVNARAQLAAKPQVKARPDLGPGAFTLTVTDAHVTNAFFLSGDNIATVTLDLSDAPHQDKQTVAQILALVIQRAS